MGRVIHFEIQVNNPERAAAFYEAVLGWSFRKWDGPMEYWLITTGPDGEPGINGGMMKRRENVVAIKSDDVTEHGTVNVSATKDVHETVKAVTANGGHIVLPVMPVPGIGWLAYAKDPEGNIFGFMQTDPAAA